MANEKPPAPPITPEQAMMQFALGNPNIPKMYANAFQLFLGTHDVTVAMSVNGVASGVLEFSYPFAKAFGLKLTELISNYEALTKTTVPSVEELEIALKAATIAK